EYVEQRATADIELFAVGDQYRGGSGAMLLQRSQAALQVEHIAKSDSRRLAQVDAGLVSQAFGLTDALPGSALGGAVATTAVQIVASAQLDDTLVSVGAGVSAVVEAVVVLVGTVAHAQFKRGVTVGLGFAQRRLGHLSVLEGGIQRRVVSVDVSQHLAELRWYPRRWNLIGLQLLGWQLADQALVAS